MNRFALLMGIVLLQLAAMPAAGQRSRTKPARGPIPSIIFDTDMGPDYDDVGALAILHAMADRGECHILATIASDRHPFAAAVLSVLNTYFGRADLPIGVVRGAAVDIGAWQKWDSLLAADYPHPLQNNDQARDALSLYREILAGAPDSSVTIVTVGFFTNVSNLLSSAPDKWSSLDGKALIAKKVRRLVSMAGRFDKDAGSFREFNVMKDAAASAKVFDSWPVPIVFSGFEIGASIFTGLPITHSNIVHSPVKDVFSRCIPMDPHDAAGRMSWDETAVLVAVRGPGQYFDTVPGRIVSHPDGSHGWDSTGTRDRYLVIKTPAAEVGALINDLMMQQPNRSVR